MAWRSGGVRAWALFCETRCARRATAPPRIALLHSFTYLAGPGHEDKASGPRRAPALVILFRSPSFPPHVPSPPSPAAAHRSFSAIPARSSRIKTAPALVLCRTLR